jgi:PBP1b-binding outer membrane lipoprotein LpoB
MSTKSVSTVAAVLIIQLFLTSCVSGFTKSTIPFHEEQPANDEAIVYIYRVKDVVGMAGPYNVRLDNKKVGLLKQNGYFVLRVTPGVPV